MPRTRGNQNNQEEDQELSARATLRGRWVPQAHERGPSQTLKAHLGAHRPLESVRPSARLLAGRMGRSITAGNSSEGFLLRGGGH